MRWWGRIDGHWEARFASVTISQNHGHTWFVLKGDFPYLAAGPSNAGPVDVARGEVISESYTITVADEPEAISNNPQVQPQSTET